MSASAARWLVFAGVCGAACVALWGPVGAWVGLSGADSRYSHLVFIPVVSVGVAVVDRARIFRAAGCSPWFGAAVAGLGWAGLAGWGGLTGSIAALAGVWVAAFGLCYGGRALRAAAFPALFLLLAIPLPGGVVERISAVLQAGSAEIAHGLFRVAGIPVFREGLAFALPGVNIEVAEECSGIRSSIALVITALLAGHVFLRSAWAKAGLVAFTAVVAVFKNAVRIVVLSAMTAYSSQDFLNSPLHHQYGGVMFSGLALAMIAPFLLLLRRRESRWR